MFFVNPDRRTPVTEIKGYHAHVYYDADTRKIAEGLRTPSSLCCGARRLQR